MGEKLLIDTEKKWVKMHKKKKYLYNYICTVIAEHLILYKCLKSF